MQSGNPGSAGLEVSDEKLPPFTLKSQSADEVDFEANFPETVNPEARVVPDIDTDAVSKAIQSIQLKVPKLQQKLESWELQQKEDQPPVPRSHAIVPRSILRQLRQTTPEAKLVSNNLSRSASIAQVLSRLDLLRSQDGFVIHVVGCDDVECKDDETVRRHFGPLVEWVAAAPECPIQIDIILVGPNVPSNLDELKIPVPKLTARPNRLQSVTVRFDTAVYSDFIGLQAEQPNMAIAFNAGIWGYREWKPTLTALAVKGAGVPFVATAYTLLECEEDFEVFKEISEELQLDDKACCWEPEMNPFGSSRRRETKSAPAGRIYRENAAWQCWKL